MHAFSCPRIGQSSEGFEDAGEHEPVEPCSVALHLTECMRSLFMEPPPRERADEGSPASGVCVGNSVKQVTSIRELPKLDVENYELGGDVGGERRTGDD